MKKLFSLFMIVFFLVAFNTTFSQGIKVGPSVGYTLIQSPDMLTKKIDEGGAGFGNPLHFGLKAKFSLPLIPLRINGHFHYTPFSSEATIGAASIENTMSLMTVSVGGEWALIPGPLSPYLGLDLQMNSIGEFKTVVKTPGGTNEFKSDGESRWGLGIGAGVEFTLIPKFDLDVAVKYNLLNLVGKESGEESINTITLTVNVLFSLL